MIVCRVEDPITRLGPYRTSDVRAEAATLGRTLTDAHRGDPQRPTPTRDVTGWADLSEARAQAFVAGFDQPEGVDAWFGPHLGALQDAGFVVGVYDVPRSAVLFGDHQVMFNRDQAQHLEDCPLTGGELHAAFEE